MLSKEWRCEYIIMSKSLMTNIIVWLASQYFRYFNAIIYFESQASTRWSMFCFALYFSIECLIKEIEKKTAILVFLLLIKQRGEQKWFNPNIFYTDMQEKPSTLKTVIKQEAFDLKWKRKEQVWSNPLFHVSKQFNRKNFGKKN